MVDFLIRIRIATTVFQSGNIASTAFLFWIATSVAMCAILAPDPQGSDVAFTFGFPSGEIADSLNFSASVTGTGYPVILEKSDLTRKNARYFRSDTLETATTGTANLECTLARDEWRQSVSIDIELRTDTRISVSCIVADQNPADTCFGCNGSRAIQLDSSPLLSVTDSLFLVWSINSISAPVIF